MRKKAYVFFATGFEVTEAIGTTDVLRRGNVETVTVSMTGDRTVTGGHGIPVVTDALFEDIDLTDADAPVLPGGAPMLNDYEDLKKAIVRHYEKGRLVAAICAALRARRIGTLSADVAPRVTPASSNTPHGRNRSRRGYRQRRQHHHRTRPGMVYAFGVAVVDYPMGAETADEVARKLLLKK